MDKRAIAFHWRKDSASSTVEKAIEHFTKHSEEYDVVLFKEQSLSSQMCCGDNVVVEVFPPEIDSMSKQKNFILEHFEKNGFKGFLHIIEDNVAIDKDPFEYIKQIENVMDVFDYSIHFSTATDKCNYLFNKFNPRLTIDVDDDAIKQQFALPDRISFTSHSNTCWMIFDFNKLDGGALKFDERFSIAMYIIIEYLARRKATKKDGQLYFMNQYLSISSEVGTFHTVDLGIDSIDNEKMQEEDHLFKSMDIDFAPDNNLDIVLDTFYQKVKEKTAHW